MKLLKTLALVALTAVGTCFAQSPSSAQTSGNLGTKYMETGFSFEDIQRIPTDIYTLGLSANLPVTSFLDVTASYSYGWADRQINAHANTLGATATAYASIQGIKPFVSAGLGYQWVHTVFGRSEAGLWGVGVGVEIPTKLITITPSISYTDDFESRWQSSQQYSFGIEASRWITKTTAAVAGVSYSDVSHSPFDVWSYNVGVRVKF